MKRTTVFIVPHGARAELTEEGWEFESSVRIPGVVVDKLVAHFGLCLAEEYLGIRLFKDENTQINAILDANGQVSDMLFRSTIPHVKDVLRSVLAGDSVDLIVPADERIAT